MCRTARQGIAKQLLQPVPLRIMRIRQGSFRHDEEGSCYFKFCIPLVVLKGRHNENSRDISNRDEDPDANED